VEIEVGKKLPQKLYIQIIRDVLFPVAWTTVAASAPTLRSIIEIPLSSFSRTEVKLYTFL
jgi:hypothetical protein